MDKSLLVRMDSDLHARITERAAARGTNLSAMLRKALEGWLARTDGDEPGALSEDDSAPAAPRSVPPASAKTSRPDPTAEQVERARMDRLAARREVKPKPYERKEVKSNLKGTK